MSLETNISKKGYRSGEKKFWPIFPGNTENDKPQGTFYWNLRRFLAVTVETLNSFF